MQSKNRETLLKIGVAAVVGLFLLDRMVLSPAIEHWKEQDLRLTTLRQKVSRGRDLIRREKSLRERWSEMTHRDLSEEGSAAENDVFQAISRWTRDSKISFSSLTTQWRSNNDIYDTFECRATAIGDQAALGRLIYELESDPLPARLEDCELMARDVQGQQIGLSLRFSFVRINPKGKKL